MISQIANLIKAFGHASHGIKRGLLERNIKIHLTLGAGALLLSVILKISTFEWLIVLFLIGVVISAELFNTAIEETCNSLRDQLRLDYQSTKLPRDLAAGAVMVMAIASALIGLIIFVPKVLMLL